MDKPFKKTHQNISEDDDDVQSRTAEEKRGCGWVGRADVVRVVQHNKVVFMPF